MRNTHHEGQMKLVCNKPDCIAKAEVLTCGWALRLRLTVPGLRNATPSRFEDLALWLPDNRGGFEIGACVFIGRGYRAVDFKINGDEAEVVYVRDEDPANGKAYSGWKVVEFVDDQDKL